MKMLRKNSEKNSDSYFKRPDIQLDCGDSAEWAFPDIMIYEDVPVYTHS